MTVNICHTQSIPNRVVYDYWLATTESLIYGNPDSGPSGTGGHLGNLLEHQPKQQRLLHQSLDTE